MVDLVQAFFTKNPVYDEKNQPISVPDWTFPGRGRVTRQLNRAKFALNTGERILDALPLRGRQAEIGADLEQQKEQLDRAGGYVELYGAYTECEALYQLDRMYALWNSLDEADQRDFNMDPMSIDWPHYAHDIQLPSTVKQARLKMQPSRGPSVDRNERLRKNVLSEDRHLAVFDLENTLIASNVVASYSWLATRHLDSTDRLRFTLKTLREAPTLWNLDRSDRSDFLRYFYRRFEDAPIDRLDDDALEMMSDLLITKSFPAGIRRVRATAPSATRHFSSPVHSTSWSNRFGRSSITSCQPNSARSPTQPAGVSMTASSPTCHRPAKPATRHLRTMRRPTIST